MLQHPLFLLFVAVLCGLPALALTALAVTAAFVVLSQGSGGLDLLEIPLTAACATYTLWFYGRLVIMTLRRRHVPQDHRFHLACATSLWSAVQVLQLQSAELSLLVLAPMLAATAWCLHRQASIPWRRDGRA